MVNQSDVFQDVVFMEEVQLGVPKITAFCKRLADRGVSFKRLPIKIEEFKESLMDSMILGRYIPGDSIVHRLDPRSKLLAMMLLILIVFWANNPLTNLILFYSDRDLLLPCQEYLFHFFIQGLKSMFFLDCLHNYFSTVFISNGNVLFEFSFVRITDYALQQAGIIFCRFVLIIFFSTLLTLTTMPLSLASAVEALLAAFKACRSPVHEIGLMLSMSLRFCSDP